MQLCRGHTDPRYADLKDSARDGVFYSRGAVGDGGSAAPVACVYKAAFISGGKLFHWSIRPCQYHAPGLGGAERPACRMLIGADSPAERCDSCVAFAANLRARQQRFSEEFEPKLCRRQLGRYSAPRLQAILEMQQEALRKAEAKEVSLLPHLSEHSSSPIPSDLCCQCFATDEPHVPLRACPRQQAHLAPDPQLLCFPVQR